MDRRRAEGAKRPRAPDPEGASEAASAGAGADAQCPPQLRGGAASRRPRPQTSSSRSAHVHLSVRPPTPRVLPAAVALGNSDNGKSIRQPESVLQLSGVVVLKTPLCFNCRLVKSLWPHALCPDASPWFHVPTLPICFSVSCHSVPFHSSSSVASSAALEKAPECEGREFKPDKRQEGGMGRSTVH